MHQQSECFLLVTYGTHTKHFIIIRQLHQLSKSSAATTLQRGAAVTYSLSYLQSVHTVDSGQ